MTLQGRVALVAGATRGAGRGIARALGEAGATVYCTGRSSREGTVDPKRPETAERVTTAGGTGAGNSNPAPRPQKGMGADCELLPSP